MRSLGKVNLPPYLAEFYHKSATQNQIKSIAMDLSCQGHGEIFAEWYKSYRGTLKTFCTKELQPQYIEELQDTIETPLSGNYTAWDQEKDIAYCEKMLELIGKKEYAKAIILYFQEHPSHGEYAGFAIKACHNSFDLKTARKIAKFMKGGFDS